MTSVPGGFQEPNSRSRSPAPSETDDLIAEQLQDLIPIVLKRDKKKDTSKQCDYCKEKGWRGIGHTESECFTKKREQMVVKDESL
jgi:hypothetical protein